MRTRKLLLLGLVGLLALCTACGERSPRKQQGTATARDGKSVAEVNLTVSPSMPSNLASIVSSAAVSPTPALSAEPLTPRASAKTSAGMLLLEPLAKERIMLQGAPSCYGQENDYNINGDYKFVLQSDDGAQTVVQKLAGLSITSHNLDPLPLVKLAFDNQEMYMFLPRFTDCHALEFYVYGIDKGKAYSYSFQVDGQTLDHFYTSPIVRPTVQDNMLVIEGGRAAGLDGATKYWFRPDPNSHTLVLDKKEHVK